MGIWKRRHPRSIAREKAMILFEAKNGPGKIVWVDMDHFIIRNEKAEWKLYYRNYDMSDQTWWLGEDI